MPGQPRYRTFERALNAQGGIEYILEWIGEAKTLSSLAHELGVSRRTLQRYINAEPERKAAYDAARRESAAAHADAAMDAIESVQGAAFPAQVAAAKAKAELHQWMARIQNRDEFSDKAVAAGAIPISIGELHLHALRAAPPTEMPALPKPDVVDAEIIPEPDKEKAA